MIKKWFDGFLLAGQGIGLAAKEKNFWLVFVPVFLVFGTIMNLLTNGLMAFQLMGAVGFFGSLEIIFNAMIGIFGVNKTFLDWAPIFFVALLQGVLIGLIVLVWKKKKEINSESLQGAGIAAGLAVLGTGCPTCGTALLTPVIGAIFAGGSALASTISGVVTILAIIVAILSLKKVGEEAYVIIISEKFKAKKAAKKHEKSA